MKFCFAAKQALYEPGSQTLFGNRAMKLCFAAKQTLETEFRQEVPKQSLGTRRNQQK
jgi:hypothetical protein